MRCNTALPRGRFRTASGRPWSLKARTFRDDFQSWNGLKTKARKGDPGQRPSPPGGKGGYLRGRSLGCQQTTMRGLRAKSVRAVKEGTLNATVDIAGHEGMVEALLLIDRHLPHARSRLYRGKKTPGRNVDKPRNSTGSGLSQKIVRKARIALRARRMARRDGTLLEKVKARQRIWRPAVPCPDSVRKCTLSRLY